MSEAWGRTGKVTLQRAMQEPDDRYVRVDGKFLGHVVQVWYPERGWCGFRDDFTVRSPTFSSRDAAIMWVLHRTAAKVWAAERPVVIRALTFTYQDVPAAMTVAHRLADMAAWLEAGDHND